MLSKFSMDPRLREDDLSGCCQRCDFIRVYSGYFAGKCVMPGAIEAQQA